MNKVEKILQYARQLDGVKYTWWTGSEKEDIFYCDEIPSMKKLREKGINCAGLINVMRMYSGREIPAQNDELIVRGGTRFWYNYFDKLGKLELFDYEKSYPLGTLLLRDYKNIIDQGHMAVICEHSKEYPKKILYGSIIHAYVGHEDGKTGRVGITNLGSSHFCLTSKEDKGYYEYAILPEDWLK